MERNNSRSRRNGLRVVAGPGMTLEARADEAELEAESLRADMLAAAARLRLVAYESLWNPERLAKRVEREAERLETQAQASGSAA